MFAPYRHVVHGLRNMGKDGIIAKFAMSGQIRSAHGAMFTSSRNCTTGITIGRHFHAY
jgi:hypothetical protein